MINKESMEFFVKMKDINENFKSLQRLIRPPVFKWVANENIAQSNQAPNPYDTS